MAKTTKKATKISIKSPALFFLNYIKETSCSPKDIIFVGNGNNDRFVSSTGCSTICINPSGTNHLDKDIWHNYIEKTDNLEDILEVIDRINYLNERVIVIASSNNHKIKEFKDSSDVIITIDKIKIYKYL